MNLTSLPGFTLTRTIPENLLLPVASGTYNVCGGVIRNQGGQIMAHLINNGGAADLLTQTVTGGPLGAIGGVAGAVNTYQLHKLGANIRSLQEATRHLTSLATGTMLLSGITLTVCAAGFIFLSKKLNQIEKRLQEIQKDVQAIRKFLESNETARLLNSLNTLTKVAGTPNKKPRMAVLSHAHSTLGEVNARYRQLFEEVSDITAVRGIEEYFTMSALGHARCSAELGLYEPSVKDLEEAWDSWNRNSKRIAKNLILRSTPERFLEPKYSSVVKTDELIDWLNFAHSDIRDLGWIDDLRARPRSFSVPIPSQFRKDKLTNIDLLEIETMKRFVSRNRVLEGYVSQAQFLCGASIKPSDFQKELDAMQYDATDEHCFVFVKNSLN